ATDSPKYPPDLYNATTALPNLVANLGGILKGRGIGLVLSELQHAGWVARLAWPKVLLKNTPADPNRHLWEILPWGELTLRSTLGVPCWCMPLRSSKLQMIWISTNTENLPSECVMGSIG